MWLGEQIDKYGIGNGVSLIITAGIIAGMPGAITTVAQGFSLTGDDSKQYGIDTVIFLVIAFVIVVAGSIIITQGQRRIPIQQAKHTRGRRGLRRAEVLPPPPREPRRGYAHHLRQLADDLPLDDLQLDGQPRLYAHRRRELVPTAATGRWRRCSRASSRI